VLGLETVKMSQNVTVVCANDLERALEKGVRVNAKLYDNGVFGEWYDRPQDDDTHTGIVVGITPIERDTAESLLREIIKAWRPDGEVGPLIERAKKVLGEK
jgi:hypothetical protein